MFDPKKGRVVIERLKKQLHRGDPIAASNIAATYRELGNARRAFHWWRRAAIPKDGDAWLEVGFCLQYGIGTRRDSAAAIKAYRQAIANDHTTEYGCEEASIISPSRFWIAAPGDLVEKSNVYSRRRLKTGTILEPLRSSCNFASSNHCGFAVAGGGWRVAWVGKPTAQCIEIPENEGRSNLQMEPTRQIAVRSCRRGARLIWHVSQPNRTTPDVGVS